MSKFLKFLFGTVLFLFAVIILTYIFYSMKCFKRVGVARISLKNEIKAKGFLYNTCSNKILNSFSLNVPNQLNTNTKSAKLAKFFEFKDMNSNINNLFIVTDEDLDIKKEGEKKLNLKIKFSSIKDLYNANIKILDLLNKKQDIVIAIDPNYYSLYIEKNKQNINLNFIRSFVSEIPVDIIEQRKLILNLIQKLKENPFDFKNHRVSIVSNDTVFFKRKTLTKKEIVNLLSSTDNLNSIKDLLILFSVMESFNVEQVYFEEFPYLGFAGL